MKTSKIWFLSHWFNSIYIVVYYTYYLKVTTGGNLINLVIMADSWIIVGSSNLDREDDSWVGEKNADRTTDHITRRGQLLMKIHNLGIKKVHKFVTGCSRVCMCG